MLDNVQLSIVKGQKFQTEHYVKIKIAQILIDNQSIDAKILKRCWTMISYKWYKAKNSKLNT